MTKNATLKCTVAAVAILVATGGDLATVRPAHALTPALRPDKPTQPEPPNPHPALGLVAHNIRTDRTADDTVSLRISNLDIKVDIVGHVAQTTILATFANTSNGPLEGDFNLQLPTGAYVTGYALDLNGQMVDGVLQSKFQAREAYEEQVRKGVDPGLAEVDSRNMFRTRIFPIFAGTGRTIRVTYITPLGADGRFELPVTTAYKVGHALIMVTSHDQIISATKVPGAILPDLVATASYSPNDQSVFTYTGLDIAFTGVLKIQTLPVETAVITQHGNGERFFEFVIGAEPAGVYRAKTLRLYWDASRSHRDDDVMEEARIIADYIAETKPRTLDLVLFSDGKPTVDHFDAPTPDAILQALKSADYSGATRLEDLPHVLPGQADICLLVSDGHNTLGGVPADKWPCRVMTLTASKTPRRDVLRTLSEANGGVFVDLAALGHDAALKQLLTGDLSFGTSRMGPASAWRISSRP